MPRRLAATFAALVLFVLLGASCGPLWSAGVEDGNLNEWSADGGGGEFNSGTADATATQLGAGAHGGSWAVRQQSTTPPESGTRLFRWAETQANDKLYLGAWIKIPTVAHPTNYWNVFQIKSKHPAGNDPFWVVNVGNRNGGMYLYLFDWQHRVSYSQSAKDLPANTWVHLEMYVDQSASGTGRVTFWQDGTLLWDRTNVSTRYADGDNQWSIDDYSDGFTEGHATVYWDDATICLARDCSS